TIDLYIDDKKVSSRTFTVASPTNKFLKGVDATFAVNNFPTAGQTTELMWSEAHQNFVIVDSHPADADWAMTVIEKNRTSTTMSFSTADKPAVITIKSPFNEPINVEIFSEDYDETKPVHIIPVGADSGGLITLSPAGESSFNRAEEDMPIFLTLD
ncbi:MAG: hypothetical protein OIF35_02955, partial [Cellvibrionaceae bacterium]|nr:hypothetical protein [Cellvibrionaceae bacterium]